MQAGIELLSSDWFTSLHGFSHLTRSNKWGIIFMPVLQMRRVSGGWKGSGGKYGGRGARAAWPQPTWSSLPTVGASLPDATAFGSSPFGPQLWDH